MAHPMGESKPGCLRVDFDRRLKLEFHGSQITSDGGLLAYRELDDALGLTEMAEGVFHDSRTGKNGWHGITGQFRQSVFGRLGGYDDVNDADRLGRDPAMRWVVGGKAIERQAASTSQMGRFETELLATDENVEALVDMNGVWIDKVHDRHPPKMIILDMDSSVSPTHGEQEGTAYNGHFGCTCYHPLFLFNQFGDLERCSLRPGNVHSADGWRNVLEPVVMRYKERKVRLYFRGDAAFASPEIYESHMPPPAPPYPPSRPSAAARRRGGPLGRLRSLLGPARAFPWAHPIPPPSGSGPLIAAPRQARDVEHGRQFWYDYGARWRKGNTVDIAALADTLSRHSPYAIQIRGIRTTFPPPRELYPLCSHPMA